MKIDTVEIKSCVYVCGGSNDMDKVVHIKQVKQLSVVQSKIGSYSIKINNDEEKTTEEGAA